MTSDLPERRASHAELRASHADRDRVVEALRVAGGDGRLDADELDTRLERALTARTQGELAALVADLPADPAAKDVLSVEQRGGRWSQTGVWTVPRRIEVRTQSCRVTLDFSRAVITGRTVVVDLDMQFGRLLVVGGPGIVIDVDGLALEYSRKKLRPAAVTDPRLRVQLVGTLRHSKVVERRA